MTGFGDIDNLDPTLRQGEPGLSSVHSEDFQHEFNSIRQMFDQYLEERAAIDDPQLQTDAPLLTGYKDLDLLLGGMQRSDLIILGARPAIGKSALALNISMNVAKTGANVGVFSMDMSRTEIVLRILAADAEIDKYRLRLGLYTETEKQRLLDSMSRLSELPLYIDDRSLQDIAEIRSKASRLSSEHGLDLLVVDYLQLIQDRSRGGESRNKEINEICRSLKGIARDLNVALITCSQLSREVEHRPGHRPQLSDLRDSGSIEREADVVLFIHREDLYYTEEDWEQHSPGRQYPKNIAEIVVAKHRNGPTGAMNLLFRDDLVGFDSVAQGDNH